ncbi:MAG: hypothetical protein AAF456_05710 [Planctomycetota bacterium]
MEALVAGANDSVVWLPLFKMPPHNPIAHQFALVLLLFESNRRQFVRKLQFVRGQALQMARQLTGKMTYQSEVEAYVAPGLALQAGITTVDGILPVRGVFDLSYQSLGLKYAGENRATENTTLKAGIRALFELSLS